MYAADADGSALPADSLRDAAEQDLAAGAFNLPRQEPGQAIITMLQLEQPVAIDRVLRSLLHRQRPDADDFTVGGVESFHVFHRSRACSLVDRDASQVGSKSQIAIRRQGRFPCQHLLQYRDAAIVVTMDLQRATARAQFDTVDFVAGKAGLSNQAPGFRRQAMHEFRAELNR